MFTGGGNGGIPMDEKRRHPRVPLLLRIDYPGEPGLGDVTENLSAEGLFIRTDRHLAAGERVPLLVSFPGLLEPLRLEVEVAWARPPAPGMPGGVAVRIPPGLTEEREQLARLARSAAEPGPVRRNYRMLLVEDNPLVMSMYDQALHKLATADGKVAVTVDFGRDGVEALARLQQGPPPDLVITDLYMPVMDGFTLLEKLRADPRIMATPVLAISAGGSDARERAVELGVDVYLQKPVKMSEILATVRALLRIAG
jgi:uncharacterized protein (TIGR02266 family)